MSASSPAPSVGGCQCGAVRFAVTDPPWLDQLNLLPAGIYPHSTFADPSTETWLTISLSEAFFGWHYKLVAGVIVRAN